MGVESTLCAVCGAPANDDQYADEGKAFVFTSDHGWLATMVAVDHDGNVTANGKVDDQILKDKTEIFVGNGCGSGDCYAVHQWCWNQVKGSNPNQVFVGAAKTPGWQEIASYHEQLFDFAKLVKDGNQWLIADPSSSDKNKSRILALIEASRAPTPAADETSIPALIKSAPWSSSKSGGFSYRFRTGLENASFGDYTTAVTITKPYMAEINGMPKDFLVSLLNGFEDDLKKAVQWKDNSIVVFSQTGDGSCRYLLYTCDFAECEKRLNTIGDLHSPETSVIESEDDPDWMHFATCPHQT